MIIAQVIFIVERLTFYFLCCSQDNFKILNEIQSYVNIKALAHLHMCQIFKLIAI